MCLNNGEESPVIIAMATDTDISPFNLAMEQSLCLSDNHKS